jgi:membrane-associated phospholipid phosphatase
MSGIEILRAIQSIHAPWLDQVMLAVSDLNSETIYILVLALFFWVLDKRLTRYAASILFLGTWANTALKYLADTDRPFVHHPELRVPAGARETAPGPAFPSGHAQIPLMVWGAVAHVQGKRWLRWGVGLIVFLIGFSRLYLGVHWPLDVLGGWAIGAALLWAFTKSAALWRGEGQSLGQQLLWAVLLPALTGGSALLFVPAAELHTVMVLTGAYLGVGVGAALEEAFVGFNPRHGSIMTHLLKVVLGFAVVMAVRVGLKPLLGESDVGTVIRYACVGAATTFAVPWLAKRFLRVRSVPPAVGA